MKRRISQIGALPHRYGKYELLERIGLGGMAEVYRARLPGIGGFEKTVVIKRLRPKHAHDEVIARLFIEEAKLAAHVLHKNVVQVFELGELDSGELYIAMEYVDGTDLRRLVERAARVERPLPPWLAVYAVMEVLEALSFAHDLRDPEGQPRNLVHCDVTPENIFVSRLGDVKLGDFGVATDDTRDDSPLAEQVKGKLPYMSPEQLLEQPIDARTDVFSAAVVLWESLAGRRLFPGRTPSEVMAQICASPRPPPSKFAPSVPRALDAVVLKALDPKIDVRFQSASTLSRALGEVLAVMRPRLALEDIRAELAAVLEAPVVRSAHAVFDQEHDDGDDELEALDRRHDGHPSRPPGDLTPGPSPGDDHSTPRPPAVDAPRPDPLSLTPTKPRTPARGPEDAGRDRAVDDGQTYRIIRSRPDASTDDLDADAILRAYLAEQDLAPERIMEPWTPPTPSGPPVLGGAGPIWVQTSDQNPTGPLTPSETLDLLEQHERRGLGPLLTSCDRRRWLTPDDVAHLLGEGLIRADRARTPIAEQGQLSERSFVELVGTKGKSQSTGRLVVWSERGSDRERVELHLLNGTLTHVSWTAAPFEVWRELLEDPLLGAHGLPEAFSRALSSRTPVASHRLEPTLLQQMGATRRKLARRRFEAALTWTRGGYRFDPSAAVHTSERGQPVLRLLPGMTYCALPLEELERRLGDRLLRPHRLDPSFRTLRKSLGLTEQEAQALSELASGEPLGSAARRADGASDGKFVWVMAYLLTELGLLFES